MKHNLKSDLNKLTNRGMTLEEDIKLLKNKSLEELINYLNNDNAVIRTSAAVNLKPYVNEICDELLLRLDEEKKFIYKNSHMRNFTKWKY